MRDMWDECYSGEAPAAMPPDQFKQTFCKICRNEECSNSLAGSTKWSARMRTQEDRLLNHPQFADPNDPRYQMLRKLDFPDMLRKAVALEISSQRGDWEIPSAKDALAFATNMKPSGFQAESSQAAEEPRVAVLWEGEAPASTGKTKYTITLVSVDDKPPQWGCTCPAFQYRTAGVDGCKHIMEAREVYEAQQVEAQSTIEDVPEPVAPPSVTRPAPTEKMPPGVDALRWQQMKERGLAPRNQNTRFPSEGLMLDGSAPPVVKPEVPADPWAAPPPPKKEQVIAVHGRVTMGGAPPKKDEK